MKSIVFVPKNNCQIVLPGVTQTEETGNVSVAFDILGKPQTSILVNIEYKNMVSRNDQNVDKFKNKTALRDATHASRGATRSCLIIFAARLF